VLVLAAMREIADKAWDAGYLRRKDEMAAYTPTTQPLKPEFMKELFLETKEIR
jgi:hypothetical protein